jgi:nucleoside-diphosphate-sugar epimerase
VAAACAARESPPTLVLVSSLAAAGPSSVDRPRVELDPPAPVSNYGRTKRAAETIAEEYAGRVPITIVRPPIVYGEGDRNMLSVYRPIHRLGVHVAFGVAHSRYSFIHVSDLAEALELCARRGRRLAPTTAQRNRNGAAAGNTQGYYFVAGEEQPTYGELGKLIGKALGRARVWVLRSPGPIMLYAVACGAEAIARLRCEPHILNFDKAREARAGSWTCSAAVIRAELGFAPRAPLVERLRQTADWYLRQKLL